MTITYEGIQPGRSGTLYDSEVLVYLFCSDDKDDDIKDVMAHVNCPRLMSKHPTYQWMFAAELSYQQGGGQEWSKWAISITYKPLPTGEQQLGDYTVVPPPGIEEPPDPLPFPIADDPALDEGLDFKAHISVGYEDFTKPEGDAYTSFAATTRAFGGAPTPRGFPIVASNLEPYDPPPVIHALNPILDIRKNILVTDPLWSILSDPDFNGSINLRGFEYREPGGYVLQVGAKRSRVRYLIDPVQESKIGAGLFAGTIKYRQVSFQFIVNYEGWQPRLLDIGTYKFSIPGTKTLAERDVSSAGDAPDFGFPANSTAVPFVDAEGKPYKRMLDGKGNPLKEGEAPVYNTYKLYKEREHLPLLKFIDNKRFFTI